MIYEYKCQSCENVQEHWQKMSDPGPEECQTCHDLGKMERIISATSFVLKGKGWYATDYKKSNAPKEVTDAPSPCAAAGGKPCEAASACAAQAATASGPDKNGASAQT